jgi:hypothetical protein
MKVKELIEKLKQYNEDKEVLIETAYGYNYITKVIEDEDVLIVIDD